MTVFGCGEDFIVKYKNRQYYIYFLYLLFLIHFEIQRSTSKTSNGKKTQLLHSQRANKISHSIGNLTLHVLCIHGHVKRQSPSCANGAVPISVSMALGHTSVNVLKATVGGWFTGSSVCLTFPPHSLMSNTR